MNTEVVEASPESATDPKEDSKGRRPYITLVRDSSSLVLVSAIWCYARTPKAAARAVLSHGQTTEEFYERNDVEVVESEKAAKAGKEWPGSLVELDHAGSPEGVTIFDDAFAHKTYEVISVCTLARVLVSPVG